MTWLGSGVLNIYIRNREPKPTFCTLGKPNSFRIWQEVACTKLVFWKNCREAKAWEGKRICPVTDASSPIHPPKICSYCYRSSPHKEAFSDAWVGTKRIVGSVWMLLRPCKIFLFFILLLNSLLIWTQFLTIWIHSDVSLGFRTFLIFLLSLPGVPVCLHKN